MKTKAESTSTKRTKRRAEDQVRLAGQERRKAGKLVITTSDGTLWVDHDALAGDAGSRARASTVGPRGATNRDQDHHDSGGSGSRSDEIVTSSDPLNHIREVLVTTESSPAPRGISQDSASRDAISSQARPGKSSSVIRTPLVNQTPPGKASLLDLNGTGSTSSETRRMEAPYPSVLVAIPPSVSHSEADGEDLVRERTRCKAYEPSDRGAETPVSRHDAIRQMLSSDTSHADSFVNNQLLLNTTKSTDASRAGAAVVEPTQQCDTVHALNIDGNRDLAAPKNPDASRRHCKGPDCKAAVIVYDFADDSKRDKSVGTGSEAESSNTEAQHPRRAREIDALIGGIEDFPRYSNRSVSDYYRAAAPHRESGWVSVLPRVYPNLSALPTSEEADERLNLVQTRVSPPSRKEVAILFADAAQAGSQAHSSGR